MGSVLVVGSVAYDDVETAAGKSENQLGGSATFFSIAASFFAPVHVVAVVGDDFRQEDLDFLRKRQVDFRGLQQVSGKTFRWGGRYSADFSERETLYTHLNVFEQFNPVIPEELQETPFVFLANIGPELQLHVLDQMKKPRFVAMDTMNFWIERSYYVVREVIARADGLIINDEEAKLITGQRNLIRAMREIKEWGPKVLIVKKGEHGAALLLDDGFFYLPAYPVEQIADPTGAGDTFAGGFMGYLAAAEDPVSAVFRTATVFGSALASFNVEGFGVEKLKGLSRKDVAARAREFQRMTEFSL